MLSGHWEFWVPFIPAITILLGIILAGRTGKWKRFFFRASVIGGLYFIIGIILLVFMPEPSFGLIFIAAGTILLISGLVIRNTKWDYKL